MVVSVTMTNAPEAPFGRADLFPTTMSLSPSILIPNWGALPVRVVIISQAGINPPIYQDGNSWSMMMDHINTILPWTDLRQNMTYYGPIPIEDLAPYPGQPNDPMDWWISITWGLYHRVGGGFPIIGIIDGTTALGQFLGSGASGITIGSNGSLLPAASILTWDGDPLSSGWVFAHEFGHTSGRRHAPSTSPTGQVAADPDFGYPYQNGNSSVGAMATFFETGALSEYGPSRGSTGSPTETPSSHQAHELMGYGGWWNSRGASDYTFGAIRQYWGIWSTVQGGGLTTGLAPAQILASPYAMTPEHVRNAAAPNHPVPSHIQDALTMKDAKAAFQKIKHTLVAVP